MRKKKSLRSLGTFCILLILVLVMIYSGLQIWESTVFSQAEDSASTPPTKTIVRNGVEYFPRQDITTMLVLGIDQSGPAVSSNYYRNPGSADSVILLIFDEINKECNVLYLNRDTMLNMDVIGVTGTYAGTAYGQLALAHTYGTGLEDSCENIRNTIMQFLGGITIDYYLSMRMDAIPILNDAVGGVTVTVVDDFSAVDPSITMGEITLHGNQVISFVRTRKNVGDQKNITRMSRQAEYVDSFLQALQDKGQKTPEFFLEAYDQAAPYLVSDCPINTLSGMLDRYTDFTINRVVTPEGSNKVVDGYYQFHADEEKLDKLILELFYAPK